MVSRVGLMGKRRQKSPVGSVLQSINLSVSFLGIGSLVFSET